MRKAILLLWILLCPLGLLAQTKYTSGHDVLFWLGREVQAKKTYALNGISYEAFITTYVNRINPVTRMYWQMDDIEAITKTPRLLLDGYLNRAQLHGYNTWLRTGRGATQEQLLKAPYLDPEYARQHLTHDQEGTVPDIPGVTGPVAVDYGVPKPVRSFASANIQRPKSTTTSATTKGLDESPGRFKKALTVALYPFTPYRRDTEDRVMNALNGGYVAVGYWDLYETLRALNASPSIRETSPVFGDYFNGRPHPAGAFAVHTAVNYAFLSGIRLAHNWAHDRATPQQGKLKRAGEYIIWGFVAWATYDRARVAIDNRNLAEKYGR